MEELVKAMTLEFAQGAPEIGPSPRENVESRCFICSQARSLLVARVDGIVKDNDAALLQQLAQRAVGTEEFNRIKLASAPPDGRF